jgi:multicopper oxidase
MSAFALAPLAARAASDDLVTYRLTAAPLGNGIAYNGTIPGPVLRVTHGQRVRVEYVNRSPIATTIHWHGMILPNAMDGAAGVTQRAVAENGAFVYEFTPDPPGTRWYHDHAAQMGELRGLFGAFIVEDPREERADVEYVVVLHDVPDMASIRAAITGTSRVPMIDPMGSSEMDAMRAGERMGDEIAYLSHRVNGKTYPNGAMLRVKVGDRVRLRILNASGTQARYVRLAGHRLRVTHADGNPVPVAREFDVLRIGLAERYDAWFEVTKPGAWLLQGIYDGPLAFQQSMLVYTDGMEHAAPMGSPIMLDGLDVLSYEKIAGGYGGRLRTGITRDAHYTLGGGDWGSSRWTMNGATWPDVPPLTLQRSDRARVRFTNKTDMDHPMHLHGHTVRVVEIDGRPLAHPPLKDTALVGSNGGTLAWDFEPGRFPGHWLLHCHNEVHMIDGMMTEVTYS